MNAAKRDTLYGPIAARGARMEIAPCTAADAARLNADLRDGDRMEHEHFAAEECEADSSIERRFRVIVGGEECAHGGVQLPPWEPPTSRARVLYLLSTRAADRHRVDYARATRAALARIAASLPKWVETIHCLPMAKYAKSVRWLEWSGWRRTGEFSVRGEKVFVMETSRKEAERWNIQ